MADCASWCTRRVTKRKREEAIVSDRRRREVVGGAWVSVARRVEEEEAWRLGGRFRNERQQECAGKCGDWWDLARVGRRLSRDGERPSARARGPMEALEAVAEGQEAQVSAWIWRATNARGMVMCGDTLWLHKVYAHFNLITIRFRSLVHRRNTTGGGAMVRAGTSASHAQWWTGIYAHTTTDRVFHRLNCGQRRAVQRRHASAVVAFTHNIFATSSTTAVVACAAVLQKEQVPLVGRPRCNSPKRRVPHPPTYARVQLGQRHAGRQRSPYDE
jgi:hypothetical protein